MARDLGSRVIPSGAGRPGMIGKETVRTVKTRLARCEMTQVMTPPHNTRRLLPREGVTRRYARWQDSRPNTSLRADSFEEGAYGIPLPLKSGSPLPLSLWT